MRMPFGASQIANDERPVLFGQATVVAREAQRIQPCVAGRVPAHDDHRFVDQNVRTIVEGHKSRRHCEKSLNEPVPECNANGSASTYDHIRKA